MGSLPGSCSNNSSRPTHWQYCYGGDERNLASTLTIYKIIRFLDFSRRALFRLRAATAGEVIELDRQHLLALVQTDAELGEIVMRAFILRRVELVAVSLGDVVLVGSTHSAGTLRIKEFLMRNGTPTPTSISSAIRKSRTCWTASISRRATYRGDMPRQVGASEPTTNQQVADCVGFNESIDQTQMSDLVVGSSLNKVLAISLQRNFSHGAFYVSYSQADARDTPTGEPIPEAPRMIWDAVASENQLPFHLQVRGEFEYVKAKPLGSGFTGVPVRQIRGAILRPFLENRISIGANVLLASGYTGQTTETLALPSDPLPLERIVGVPLKSYVSLSWTYYFKK
jgi:hypothetical protein